MDVLVQDTQYKSPYIEILQREVNHRVRYYSLRIYKTLFDEYLLEIQYGSKKNKSPTGKQEHYFTKLEEALSASMKKIEEKIKKGYSKV